VGAFNVAQSLFYLYSHVLLLTVYSHMDGFVTLSIRLPQWNLNRFRFHQSE